MADMNMNRRDLLFNTMGFVGAYYVDAKAQVFEVNISDFGAVGDGQVDDSGPIQRAIDFVSNNGGGVVKVPRNSKGRYWRIGKPLLLRSRVWLRGEGTESVLFNDRVKSEQFMDQAVILPGNYHPAFLNRLKYEVVLRHESNPRRLFIDQKAQNFAIGSTVFVRTSDFNPDNAEWSISSDTWICRVLNFDGTILEVDRDIPPGNNLLVSSSDTSIKWRPGIIDTDCFVCIGSGVSDVTIKSHGFWVGDSSARECFFRGLTIHSSVGVYGNLYQECEWRDITCYFTRQLVELSCNSKGVTIRNLRGEMTKGGSPQQLRSQNQLIAIQENSSECSVKDFEIRADAFDRFGSVVRFGPSKKNLISKGSIYCANAKGALVSFDTAVGAVAENVISDISVFASRAAVSVAFVQRNSGSVNRNIVRNCTFNNNNNSIAVRIGGSENVVNKCIVSGSFSEILAGAVECKVIESAITKDVRRYDVCKPNRQFGCMTSRYVPL